MNINDLTLGQLKERLAEAEEIRSVLNLPGGGHSAPLSDDSHWEVGKLYFIRTVTHHLCGRLVKVTSQELVLEDAAWVADDGRFAEALSTGECAEVEPFPDGTVIVGRGALIDGTVWTHAPLRAVK